MTKKFRLAFLTSVLSIALLAACNTAEEDSSSETVSSDTEAQETVDSQNAAETAEPTNEEANESNEADDANVNGKEEQPAQGDNDNSITYTSNGETKSGDVTTASGEQYSMKVLNGFTFTAEEPGKDVVYYDEDDSVFMRVEVMSTADTTFDDLVSNTEEMMTAISESYEAFDIAPLVKDQELANQAAYVAELDAEEITAIVYEKGDKIIRLSVYDNEENDLSEAMIKMGLTIE